MTKDKARQWDGRSRPSTALYKQNFEDIFNKKKKIKKTNYNEKEMRMLANMLGKQELPTPAQPPATQPPIQNRLPIPVNENNMPMFNTDTEYMQYLNEYDPAMFDEMQNTYYNTKGTMSEGKIEPMKYFKNLIPRGLLDYFGGD